MEEWKKTITELAKSEDFRNTDAIEIWNEPNNDAFDSAIEPEVYYEMLKSAYTIISNYTTIPVIFAGISPNALNHDWQDYLTTVFSYGTQETILIIWAFICLIT